MPDDAPARQIADMNAADDRRDVMLAMGFEPDVAQQDHLVVTGDFLEGAVKIFARILEIAGKPFFVGANNARRRAAKAFSIGSSPAHWMSVRTAFSAVAREGVRFGFAHVLSGGYWISC